MASAIGTDDCLLVGGLAVAVHGYPRATDDVDFVTRIPLRAALARLTARGIAARLRRGDPVEGDFDCVTGFLGKVRFDVLPQLVPIDWERSMPVELDEMRIRVVDLEALLRLKLRAGGPQDLLDAAFLLLRHPALRETAREIARAYKALERLDSFLESTRVRAKVREQEAADRQPQKRRHHR